MPRMIITRSVSHRLVFVQCPCSKYCLSTLTTMTETTSYNIHKVKCSHKERLSKHIQRFYYHWHILASGFNLSIICRSGAAPHCRRLGFQRCEITARCCHCWGRKHLVFGKPLPLHRKLSKSQVSRNQRISNNKSIPQICQQRADDNILVSLYLPFNILVCCLWMQGTEVERRFDKCWQFDKNHTSAECSPPVHEIRCLHHLQRAFRYE